MADKMTQAQFEKIMHGPVPPMAFWELAAIFSEWLRRRQAGSISYHDGPAPRAQVGDGYPESDQEQPDAYGMRVALMVHELAKEV